MIPKPFEEIVKSDIDSLVTQRTAERRTLEYKEALPGNGDEDKKEFLYDVSSFANAAGGDLIFGVRDLKDANGKATGIPDVANGLTVTNPSAEIARLENIVQSGIAPRIPGLKIRDLGGFLAGPVIIIRIPKSWALPHMVTYKSARFYSRNSTGKYPLDIFEIRSAFALSEALPEKLRAFRDRRLSAIVADETPLPLPRCGKVILHLVPIASLDPTVGLDLSDIYKSLITVLRPIESGGGWSHRFNFDGFLTYSANSNYVQLFRSGAIEAIDANLLNMKQLRQLDSSVPNFISAAHLEQDLISAISSYTQLQKRIGINPPIFVMVTLLGVNGFTLTTGPTSFSSNVIDRDVLLLPDVRMDDFPGNASAAASHAGVLLKPIFDAIAQAAGLPGSLSYDQQGVRKS